MKFESKPSIRLRPSVHGDGHAAMRRPLILKVEILYVFLFYYWNVSKTNKYYTTQIRKYHREMKENLKKTEDVRKLDTFKSIKKLTVAEAAADNLTPSYAASSSTLRLLRPLLKSKTVATDNEPRVMCDGVCWLASITKMMIMIMTMLMMMMMVHVVVV